MEIYVLYDKTGLLRFVFDYSMSRRDPKILRDVLE